MVAKMTTFYLVRHGHAVWTCNENRPLSPQGRQGAQQVANLLRGYPIAAIYASPARRAQQTVAPLAAALGVPVHVAPELAERVLCAEAVEDFDGAVRATWEDFGFAHPGGETNAAAQRRGMGLIARLNARRPHDHVVLGTHGNLLALVLRCYDPAIGYAFWQALTMPDVYRLEVRGDEAVSIKRLLEK